MVDVPVLVLISAPWAGPARPAPTVARELSRRWGAAIRILLVEDPTDEQLERYSVDVLPTWLQFVPVATGDRGAEGEQTPEQLILPELSGSDLAGDEVILPGPWLLVHRRTGAQPKHVIDAEFGPAP